MQQHAKIIDALIAAWPDMPDLVGSDWERIEGELLFLIEQYSSTINDSRRTEHEVALLAFVELYPSLAQHIKQALVFQQGATNATSFEASNDREALRYLRESIDLAPPLSSNFDAGSPADILRDRDTVVRYTDITCPRLVSRHASRISVIVRLTVDPSLDSGSVTTLRAHTSLPVRVRIDAPAFVIISPVEQDVLLLPDADSPPIVFDLRPTRLGSAIVTFDFFQAGHVLGTTSLVVEVVDDQDIPASDYQHGSRLVISTPDIAPPEYMLYISYEPSQDQPALFFELRPFGGVGQRFPAVRLTADPKQYAAHVYRRLTALAMQVDPTVEGLGDTLILDEDAIDQRLQEECQNLWRDLIPEELKAIYAQERHLWRDRSVLLVSDEPYLPWELLWPYGDDWVDDEPLCLTTRLSRWLRREVRHGRSNSEPRATFSLQPLALIVPPDSGLPAAQQEQQLLRAFAQQLNVQLIEPRPTRRDVMALLSQGGYDWLHIAAHGSFHADDPDRESAIWLEGGEPLTSQAIVGRVEMQLRRDRSAIMFNACEVGRSGLALTGVGGWANRVVSAGAGLFFAPMWAVTDEPAQIFAEQFYTALGSGQPIADACRIARRAARLSGDLTWLAYSLYAHPNACMIIDPYP